MNMDLRAQGNGWLVQSWHQWHSHVVQSIRNRTIGCHGNVSVAMRMTWCPQFPYSDLIQVVEFENAHDECGVQCHLPFSVHDFTTVYLHTKMKEKRCRSWGLYGHTRFKSNFPTPGFPIITHIPNLRLTSLHQASLVSHTHTH